MSRNKVFAVGSIVVAIGVLLGTLLPPSSSATAQERVRRSSTEAPKNCITSGKLISVAVYTYPLNTRNSTNYGQVYKGGRVDVYDRFIILTTPDGDRTLVLHGYYTDLWFKSE